MTTCPRCGMRGVHTEDNFTSCFYCGETISDHPDLIDKLASNAKKDQAFDDNGNIRFGRRLTPIEAPADVMARVLAAVRAEASR